MVISCHLPSPAGCLSIVCVTVYYTCVVHAWIHHVTYTCAHYVLCNMCKHHFNFTLWCNHHLLYLSSIPLHSMSNFFIHSCCLFSGRNSRPSEPSTAPATMATRCGTSRWLVGTPVQDLLWTPRYLHTCVCVCVYEEENGQ